MQPEISVSVAIIIERKTSTHRWADYSWSAVGVVAEAPPTEGWQICLETEGVTHYMRSPLVLTLHRKLGEAYDANIETGTPSVWILMDDDEDPESVVPWKIRAVTADPFEAQGMLDAAEGLVERVPMPEPMIAWMANFLKQMPEPEKFRKRKRQPANFEEPQFGKEPIFAPSGQRRPGDGS